MLPNFCIYNTSRKSISDRNIWDKFNDGNMVELIEIVMNENVKEMVKNMTILEQISIEWLFPRNKYIHCCDVFCQLLGPLTMRKISFLFSRKQLHFQLHKVVKQNNIYWHMSQVLFYLYIPTIKFTLCTVENKTKCEHKKSNIKDKKKKKNANKKDLRLYT